MLLVHYRGGLQGDTLKDTEMIARLGYVVFAEDIFGKDHEYKDRTRAAAKRVSGVA